MDDMGTSITHSYSSCSLQGREGREEAQELPILQRAYTLVYGSIPGHGFAIGH